MQIPPRAVRALALLAVLGALAPVGLAQALLRSDQRAYATGLTSAAEGYYPQGHVLADLDGDGDLDCVVAQIGNFLTPNFTLLWNRGDGSFDEPEFVPISGETADVVAGDFDGDGDIDLAFCVGGYGTGDQWVSVFKNDGTGAFGQEQMFVCGIGPTGIVAFDADRDGDLDLATANWYWNEADVSVLYNNGAGDFSARVDFPVPGQQLYKLDAGDLNGDLWPDLVVSTRGGSPAFALLLNDLSGGFGAPTLFTSPQGSINEVPGIKIADVDLDGDRDVLYSGGANIGLFGSIALYRNNGAALNTSPESFAVNIGRAGDFEVADVTLDGRPDILCVGHSDKYGYSVVPSTATGFGASFTVRAGENARSVTAGDVDGDGDADVVVANSGSLTISVHQNDAGVLRLPYHAPVGAFCNGIASADIDHDGDVDVVTTDTRIWTLLNDGAGALTPNLQTATIGTLTFPQLADLDGDGWEDLVVRAGSVRYARNESATTPGFFGPITTLSTAMGNVSSFDLADFDGDGDLDVCGTVVSGPNKVVVLMNLGGFNFGAPILLSSTTITGGGTIVAADFDNDGDNDIVYGNGQAVAWRNNGSGGFSGPILSNAGGGFLRVVAGDFDGDGKLDLAGVNYDHLGLGENMVMVRGVGDLTFTSPTTHYGMFSLQYGGTTSLDTLDVDGDGALDIVCGAYGGNDVTLFLNNGSGGFLPPVGYGVDGAVLTVGVADVNGDSRPDVLANIGTEPPLGGSVTVLFGTTGFAPTVSYCTAGVTTNGCSATMSVTGTPSLSQSSGFSIAFSGAEGVKQGLIFYGVSGRVAFPWGPSSSFLCVKSPTQRTAIASTGGVNGQCDGALSIDWLAFLAANPGALGQPFQSGAIVDAQGWFRDPPSPKTTHLTNAIEFAVQP